MIEAINFINLSLLQNKEVLFWRNHPLIKRYMVNKKEISISEHLQFIEKLKNDLSKSYFYVHENQAGVGTFSLTNIKRDSAEVGIYVNPFLLGKGYGSKIIDYIINYSLNELSLETLFLEVYKNNNTAIHLYEKNKFVAYDETADMFKMKRQLLLPD